MHEGHVISHVMHLQTIQASLITTPLLPSASRWAMPSHPTTPVDSDPISPQINSPVAVDGHHTPSTTSSTSAHGATPSTSRPIGTGTAAVGLISHRTIFSTKGPRPSWSTCRPPASASSPLWILPNPLTRAADPPLFALALPPCAPNPLCSLRV